jgi:hypothetical protein
MSNLKVFTNDYEWFVAEDKNDLLIVIEKYWGESMEDMGGDINDWEDLETTELLKISCELQDFNPDEYPNDWEIWEDGEWCYISATAEEWANHNGKGFLCSTEY